MENQPERQVEKWLRRAAQERRAGGPFELHPATRRLLQGEVARQFPRGAEPNFLAKFWPRIAFGLAGALALFLVLLSIIPSAPGNKQVMLAKKEAPVERTVSPAPPVQRSFEVQEPAAPAPKDERDLKKNAAPSPAAAAAPTLGAAYSSAGADKDSRQTGTMTSADSLDLPAARAAGQQEIAQARGNAVGGRADSADTLALTKQKAQLTPRPSGLAGGVAAPTITAQPEPSISPALVVAESSPQASSVLSNWNSPAPAETSASNFVQRFVRAQPQANNLRDSDSAARGIMVSFQLEQSGQQLRAVDQDGSVYIGSLQQLQREEAPTSRRLAKRAEPQPARFGLVPTTQTGAQGFQAYSFQLSGTNRSLNQPVMITGTLAPTNLAEMRPPGTTWSSTRPLPLTKARVSGRAVVGNTQTIEINAVPAKP